MRSLDDEAVAASAGFETMAARNKGNESGNRYVGMTSIRLPIGATANSMELAHVRHLQDLVHLASGAHSFLRGVFRYDLHRRAHSLYHDVRPWSAVRACQHQRTSRGAPTRGRGFRFDGQQQRRIRSILSLIQVSSPYDPG